MYINSAVPVVLTKSMSISASQLLTLNANPIVVLSSPGTGFLLSVISCTYTTVWKSKIFLGVTPRAGLFYKNFVCPALPNVGVPDLFQSVASAAVIQTGDTSVSQNLTLMVSQPIVFTDFNDWTDGDISLNLNLVYYVAKA